MPAATDNQDTLVTITRRWPSVAAALQRVETTANIERYSQNDVSTLAIDDILIGSLYDSTGEAALQATLIPAHSSTATVYGIGNGALIRTLLQRERIRQLSVVMLNPAVERICLDAFPAADWLSDARVQLSIAQPDTTPQPPFAALPAALRLAGDDAARLRDQLLLELNTPYIRENFEQRAVEFRAQMQANEDRMHKDGDVASLFGTRAGCTAVIAAAGPTLAQHYDWLRSRREAFLLIAVDATLIPLLRAGIEPDIVITIDGLRAGIYPYFDTDLSAFENRPLVYFPIVHPDVVARWPGPRLTAYANHAIYNEISQRQPKGCLFASGTVTHAATDLAVQMGAGQIVYAGADFGFPNERTHVEGSAHVAQAQSSSGSAWVHNGHGERIQTLPNLRAYLRDLEAYIARHQEVRFYNASRDGALICGAAYDLPESIR